MTRPRVPLWRLPLAEALDVRHRQGIAVYRGGDASAPFVGNAAAEAYEEALDVLVYAGEMLRQGASPEAVRQVERLALALVDVLGAVLRAAPAGTIPATR